MTTQPTPHAQGADLLAELAASTEVRDLLKRLSAAQRWNDDHDLWETPRARRVEAAMGHLAMALDAARGL